MDNKTDYYNYDNVINIIDNDLYKYLNIIIIEQRGIHSLIDYSNKPEKGTLNHKRFIHNFIELAMLHLNHNQASKNFLLEFDSNVDNNLMVHITRDCQIIETGRHYASISFKIEKETVVNNLTFSCKFNQNFNELPIGDEKIFISYNIDSESSEKNSDCIYNYSHSFNIKDKILYRSCLFNQNFDINHDIINNLKCSFLIPKNYKLKPKLSPDACLIS